VAILSWGERSQFRVILQELDALRSEFVYLRDEVRVVGEQQRRQATLLVAWFKDWSEQMATLSENVEKIRSANDRLLREVGELTTTVDGVVTAETARAEQLRAQAAEITRLQEQLANAGNVDPALVDQVGVIAESLGAQADSIDANAGRLAAAIASGTAAETEAPAPGGPAEEAGVSQPSEGAPVEAAPPPGEPAVGTSDTATDTGSSSEPSA